MASDRLGVVVVGTGFGCLTHVPALRAAGFDVRGLVGQDPVRTAERATTPNSGAGGNGGDGIVIVISI